MRNQDPTFQQQVEAYLPELERMARAKANSDRQWALWMTGADYRMAIAKEKLRQQGELAQIGAQQAGNLTYAREQGAQARKTQEAGASLDVATEVAKTPILVDRAKQLGAQAVATEKEKAQILTPMEQQNIEAGKFDLAQKQKGIESATSSAPMMKLSLKRLMKANDGELDEEMAKAIDASAPEWIAAQIDAQMKVYQETQATLRTNAAISGRSTDEAEKQQEQALKAEYGKHGKAFAKLVTVDQFKVYQDWQAGTEAQRAEAQTRARAGDSKMAQLIAIVKAVEKALTAKGAT